MRGHRFHMAKSHLELVTPTEVKRTVAPKRQKNADLRTGEHLTPGEVETLVEAARGNRHGHRDATMILLTYRHGLRAAEVCDLRWDQVDFNGAVLHVRRVKNGTPSTHPLHGDELRALRRLQRESPTSPFVFVTPPPLGMRTFWRARSAPAISSRSAAERSLSNCSSQGRSGGRRERWPDRGPPREARSTTRDAIFWSMAARCSRASASISSHGRSGRS
jgi:integrase